MKKNFATNENQRLRFFKIKKLPLSYCTRSPTLGQAVQKMFRVQVVLPIGRSLLGRGRILSLTNKFCKRLSSTNDFEAEVSPESVGFSEVRLEHAFQQFEEDALSPPFSTGGSSYVVK